MERREKERDDVRGRIETGGRWVVKGSDGKEMTVMKGTAAV